MQENTSTSSGELRNVPLTGADKVAYAFYATAATAALVGQVWAGVTHIPWPDEGFSTFLKIALVTPAVAVIELGGVATAALADLRRRKGEQAYAYRAMSLFAALVALVFNVAGHWSPEERFLAFGFGGLSAFAYVLWLIHSSARRRDALRKAGQMANTGPVYGFVQWAREPKVTWLARSLALEHGYGLYESLRQAREQMRKTARRVAIAGTVAEFIRSEQQDERLAKIAETTYDPDRLAGMLEDRINYEVITNKLTKAGWELGGERLKTAPRGYDAEHRRIDLLRRKSLHAGKSYAFEPVIHTADLLDEVRADWKSLRPLIEWLARTSAE